MANFMDYLSWRGDLTMQQSPLNEVDGVILARFSYAPFECAADAFSEENPTIGSVCAKLLAVEDLKSRLTQEDDWALLQTLMQCPRFRSLRLLAHENKLDLESQTQFSAVTVQISDDQYYIAFRGTDRTLVGWKEDFNMSFVHPVPAQTLAVEYFTAIANTVCGELFLGGHSKGGNLAVYASAFCPADIQPRIRAVYNFDGPGFDACVLDTASYQAVCSRVHTFVPQSSIVGMLLEHEETYSIVHSTQKTGIWQHDIYSWQLMCNQFTCLDTVTNSSRFINSALKAWLTEMDRAKREKFVDTCYALLRSTNAQTLDDLGDRWFACAKTILKAARHLDESDRKIVSEALRTLMKCAKNEIFQRPRK